MKDKKKSIPIKPRGMSPEARQQLVSDSLRDAIRELTTAQIMLAEGAWENTTDLLAAMTMTRYGRNNANDARRDMWERAKERGATKKDLQLVRATPALYKAHAQTQRSKSKATEEDPERS